MEYPDLTPPCFLLFISVFQTKGDVQERELKKNDWTGYDKDLVEALERDIISQNPNVKWYLLVISKPSDFFHYIMLIIEECS